MVEQQTSRYRSVDNENDSYLERKYVCTDSTLYRS